MGDWPTGPNAPHVEPPLPTFGGGGFTSDHYHDFLPLLEMGRTELYSTLAQVHTDIANLTEQIAFIKATDAKNSDRYVLEGSRDALSEKKWLILKLLER